MLSAKAPNEKIPFIAEADLKIYQKYRDPAFEVQVRSHSQTFGGEVCVAKSLSGWNSRIVGSRNR